MVIQFDEIAFNKPNEILNEAKFDNDYQTI